MRKKRGMKRRSSAKRRRPSERRQVKHDKVASIQIIRDGIERAEEVQTTLSAIIAMCLVLFLCLLKCFVVILSWRHPASACNSRMIMNLAFIINRHTEWAHVNWQ